MSEMHTIAHFLRLAPAVRRSLAERLNFWRPEDGERTDITNQWLLRARDSGQLDALGTAVQLAPQ